MRTKYLPANSAQKFPLVGEAPPRKEDVVSDLVDCQKVVERMLTDGKPLAEIEEYIERGALDELEKAGLWMLAWAHQDPATQLRLAKETLALASSLQTGDALTATEAHA